MKTADFAAHLTEFLSHYLPELKNISTNTISSYCDAFRLFLGYCQDVEGMRLEKLSIDDLTPELWKTSIKAPSLSGSPSVSMPLPTPAMTAGQSGKRIRYPLW